MCIHPCQNDPGPQAHGGTFVSITNETNENRGISKLPIPIKLSNIVDIDNLLYSMGFIYLLLPDHHLVKWQKKCDLF